MIDRQVLVPAAHERVVGVVLVRIDHTPSPNLLHSYPQKRLGPYILDYFDAGPVAASQECVFFSL